MIFTFPHYSSKVKGYFRLLLCEASKGQRLQKHKKSKMGPTNRPTDGRTKRGIESRSTQLKSGSQLSIFWHIPEKHDFHFLEYKLRISIERSVPQTKLKG